MECHHTVGFLVDDVSDTAANPHYMLPSCRRGVDSAGNSTTTFSGATSGEADDAPSIVESALKQRLERMEAALDSSRRIAQHLDPLTATDCITSECCALLKADRASLFMLVGVQPAISRSL